MTPAETIMAALEAVTVLGGAAIAAMFHGRLIQRVDAVEQRIAAHDLDIAAIRLASEGTRSAVDSIVQKIDGMVHQAQTQQQLAASELGRVADSIKSGHELLGAKIDGMDHANRVELDAMKHDMRGVKMVLDQQFPRSAARAAI